MSNIQQFFAIKLQRTQVSIEIDQDTQPHFGFKSERKWSSKVEDELERLKADGVISPVTFSKWAAPIVPFVKVTAR